MRPTVLIFKLLTFYHFFERIKIHCVSRNEKEGRGLDHKMSSANIEMELQQREGINCVFHLFLLFFFSVKSAKSNCIQLSILHVQ